MLHPAPGLAASPPVLYKLMAGSARRFLFLFLAVRKIGCARRRAPVESIRHPGQATASLHRTHWTDRDVAGGGAVE